MPRSDRPTQLTASVTLPRARAWALLAVALLLAACGSMPRGTAPASDDRAERLLQQGDAASAAAMFERLAEQNPPPDGPAYAQRAVRAWIAANRPADAQRVYAAITAPTTEPQATQYRVLGIDVLVARGDPAEAWRRASQLQLPPGRAEQLVVYDVQRRTALAAGRPVEAVQAGIAAERLAATDAERASMRRDLLLQLRQAADRGVRLDPAATRDALVRGWIELGQIASNAGRVPLAAAGDVERWRTRYPGHPASTIALSDVLGSAGSTQLSVVADTQIGVLLPLTGPAAPQAMLVRDGLQAAFNSLPESQRPALKVYDTAAQGVASAMTAAQSEGAGFIVGPLTRSEVAEAAEQNVRGMPMLLLNYLPNDRAGGSQVWQFALSPEDEARQVARRALAADQKRAIVIAPTGDWGNRVVAAFRDELTRGGGNVIMQSSYDLSRPETISSAVSGALRIDESRARHKRIEEIVGARLNFEARRRGDVQMIFAAGYDPLAVRQIRPQLRFFYAGAVPTYMTSEGFEPSPAANRDIDGVIFPDSPWVLQTSGPVAEVREQTRASWTDKSKSLSRLFAFGYDAGQLVLALRNPQSRWPLPGITGKLAPDGDRRFTRELDWAEIRSGQPQLAPPRL